MLWDSSALDGYAIEASDGLIGRVGDFLFEDTNWVVRWLVVDTGSWLSGREILLPTSALGEPDPSSRQFPIKLTIQQVRESPDIDTDRPVSRQHETHIYHHYGWAPHWENGATGRGGAAAATRAVAEDIRRDAGDPHLRSTASLTGCHIHAVDGEIGHVEDFLLEETDWSIRYIKVDTKNWWPGNRVLISPRSVRGIDWTDKVVHLDVERQKVKNSPPYDPSMTVDGAYDETFLTYYGIKWVQA